MEHHNIDQFSIATKGNIAKLALLMDRVANMQHAGFDMMMYYSGGDVEELAEKSAARTLTKLTEHDCKTTACAAGWAYVSPEFATERDRAGSFDSFLDNTFCCGPQGESHSIIFTWLFSAMWAVLDNSAKGVAARARYMLFWGVPIIGDGVLPEDLPKLYKDYLK